MVVNLKVSIKMLRNMGLANSAGQMETNSWDVLKKDSNMVKEKF